MQTDISSSETPLWFLVFVCSTVKSFIILKLPLQWFSRLLPLHNLHEVPTQRDNAHMCSYD